MFRRAKSRPKVEIEEPQPRKPRNPRLRICTSCNGWGIDDDGENCQTCGGSGTLKLPVNIRSY